MSDTPWSFNEYQRRFPFFGIYLVPEEGYTMRDPLPKIVCKDGFSLSVQASRYHYCNPRANEMENYYEVEVGFPARREELLMPYAEDPDNPTGTVYSYVPVKLVETIVAAHGGVER